jgi:DNA-binding Lrp family transcriptional regulator
MKPFSQLTRAQILALTNEELNDAIRLEAIERNIAPPITLSEALRRSEWRGYQRPAEAIKVFRIRQGYYVSDFGWLDEAQAQAALAGVVKIEKINYSRDDLKITSSDASVEVVWVGVNTAEEKAAKFEEFFQDNTKFDEVRDLCLELYRAIRQEDYNAKVQAEKKAEYLRLAQNDEAIAKAFWAKAEGTPWPEEVPAQP